MKGREGGKGEILGAVSRFFAGVWEPAGWSWQRQVGLLAMVSWLPLDLDEGVPEAEAVV